jgi:hypothetical protein
MAISVAGKHVAIGAIDVAVGGVLAIIGTLLPWQSLAAKASPATSVNGFDSPDGKVIVVMALMAMAVAAAWIAEVKPPFLSLGSLGMIAMAAGLIILLLSLADLNNIKNDVDTINGNIAGTASVGTGVYLDAVAGMVLFGGGALGPRKKS